MTVLQSARAASVNIRKLRGTHPLIDSLRRMSYRFGNVEVFDFDGDLSMTLDLSEHMAGQIFWFGYYSRDIVAILKRHLKPGDVFIDGGANIGELTLVAAKCVGPTGKVVSFEPVETIHEKLARHVSRNGFDGIVTLQQMGLSDRTGEDTIYAATSIYDDGSAHTGLGTIYPTAERGAPIGTIDLTTLDVIAADMRLARLAGIKLDIEGAELGALKGAREVLARFKPWLIVEIGRETCRAAGYEPDEVLAAMPGYSFARIERHGRLIPIAAGDLQDWQNVMCLPS